MEPRTTGEGEKQLVKEGQEIGIQANTATRSETHVSAVLPVTGIDLSAYSGGIAGALISFGLMLCIIATFAKGRRRR